MSLLHKNIVLMLNRNWQAIHTTCLTTAYCMLASGAATALDVDDDENMTPVDWATWLSLPVRETDNSIGTVHGRVRVPTIIVAAKFDKVPVRRPRLNKAAIYRRDGGKCAYTGKPLAPHEGNLDHIIPRSRGGASTWSNLVLADKKVNTKKADKTPEECGLTLKVIPTTPKAKPLPIHNPGIKDWKLFLKE